MSRTERHFEFRSKGSQKYWRVRWSGPSLIVEYGRIGRDPLQNTKTFRNAEEAQKAGEKLVREKLRKGYKERKLDKRSKLIWGVGHPRFDELVEGLERAQDRAKEAARAERERIAKLPKKLKAPLDWDALEALLRPGRVKKRAPLAKMAPFPGLRVCPPSYAETMRRFGSVSGWDLVYQKKAWPNFLHILGKKRAIEERALLIKTYREWAPERAARCKELVPFASDASSHHFCWDSKAVDARGEPSVYVVDFKGYPGSIRRIGRDFLEVLQHYRPYGTRPPND